MMARASTPHNPFGFILVLASCAHSGAPFQTLPASNPDSAIVYLFRTSEFGGAPRNPGLYVDGTKLLEIANGGYARLELSPGSHEFRVETDATFNMGTARITVESGKEYFAKYELEPELRLKEAILTSSLLGAAGAALFYAPDKDRPLLLEFLEREKALPEISETTMISPSVHK